MQNTSNQKATRNSSSVWESWIEMILKCCQDVTVNVNNFLIKTSSHTDSRNFQKFLSLTFGIAKTALIYLLKYFLQHLNRLIMKHRFQENENNLLTLSSPMSFIIFICKYPRKYCYMCSHKSEDFHPFFALVFKLIWYFWKRLKTCFNLYSLLGKLIISIFVCFLIRNAQKMRNEICFWGYCQVER